MTPLSSRKAPRWKQAIGAAGLLYAVVAWILPLCLRLVFGPLPYLADAGFLGRLAPWMASTAAFGTLMALAQTHPYRRSSDSRERWETVKGGVVMVASLALAAAVAAWLSPNLWGALVKVTPGVTYRSRVEVVDAGRWSRNRGEGYRSIDLEVRSAEDGQLRYIDLSARFFGTPPIAPGDRLTFYGKQNVFGVYVDAVSVSP